jgi:alkylated DNA repair dioxygenase AlkB
MDDPLPLPRLLRELRNGSTAAGTLHRFDLERQCAPTCPDFSGVSVLVDFFGPDAERRILDEIEALPFRAAQSGKQKQHHGARVNFNERRVNAARFHGLPGYARRIHEALHQRLACDPRLADARLGALRRAVEAFEPTDVFVLRYLEADASNLDLHRDDTFAYGEVILDASFESDSVLTFLGPGEDPVEAAHCVRVPLPARSLAILHGAARDAWEHAILPQDVHGRRTSVTLRTLSDALRDGDVGRQILARARGPALD